MNEALALATDSSKKFGVLNTVLIFLTVLLAVYILTPLLAITNE